MKFKFRGSIKDTKEIVDIYNFEGRIAKCGDSKDRDIDEFNTIFYPKETFAKEILNVNSENEKVLDYSENKIKSKEFKKSK